MNEAINHIEEMATTQIEINQQQIREAVESQIYRIETELTFIKRQLEQYNEADDQAKQGLASSIHGQLIDLGRNLGIENYLRELNGSMKILQGIRYATRHLEKAE